MSLTDMAPLRAKKWERRSDTRAGELIEAAIHCFGERGFAATRLDDVAARAGVSKATVYLYFDSKEDLFEAVVRAAVSPSLDKMDALVERHEGTTPDLVRTLLAILETALDGPFPAMAKLVLAESGNFPELSRVWVSLVPRRGFSLVERIVQRGVERGEFRAVDPAIVAPLIMAPVVLLGIWKHSFGKHTSMQLDRHAILVEHAETIVRGLAPTAAKPRKRR